MFDRLRLIGSRRRAALQNRGGRVVHQSHDSQCIGRRFTPTPGGSTSGPGAGSPGATFRVPRACAEIAIPGLRRTTLLPPLRLARRSSAPVDRRFHCHFIKRSLYCAAIRCAIKKRATWPRGQSFRMVQSCKAWEPCAPKSFLRYLILPNRSMMCVICSAAVAVLGSSAMSFSRRFASGETLVRCSCESKSK